MISAERPMVASEPLTPLVLQLASQLRASRTGSAMAKSFPEREAESRPHLRDTLERIKSAADQSAVWPPASSVREAVAQAAHLLDTESSLRSSQDDIRRERARADDFERRSHDLLDKTQAMLSDAGDRLAAAEARAEAAENDLAFLKDFVKERLGA